jgi:iron complex outermembrane receptor protein
MKLRRTCAAPVAGFGLAAALATAPARADPDAQSADPRAGALEVTVRGSAAPAFSSRASADDSPREPTDAASLLQGLPSVHVRRLGPEGSLASFSIRGSASTQVGVVLAGVPLTSAADPSFDLASLPLWPGASLRVYRGFAPASLGTTGYLGGLLSIDPPAPVLGQRTEWWLFAGSFGSLKLRLGDLRQMGDVRMGTGFFAARSTGDFTYDTEDPRTRRLSPVVRANAGYASVGGIERVSVTRPWGSAGAMLFAEARKRGIPGSAAFPATLPSLSSSRIVASTDATLRATPLGILRATLWGRHETSTFADPEGELDPTRPNAFADDAIDALGGSISLRGQYIAGLSTLFALDMRAERLSRRDRQGASRWPPPGRIAAGAASEIEWRRRWLRLFGSGRIDWRRDDAEGAQGPAGIPLGTSMDLAPSGHVGASAKLADPLTLAVHAGALQRPPSFLELFGDQGLLIGDPSLRPERALSADLGLQGDGGDDHVAVGYELVGFVTSTRDLITFVPLGRGTFRARNIDRAMVFGLELSARLAARSVSTSLSYTLMLTENRSPDPFSNGQPLPGRPVHDLAYDAAYRVGPVVLRYQLDAVAGTTVDTAGTLVLPARVLHGAGITATLPWLPDLRAGIEVQNLFDLRTLYVDSPLLGLPVAVPVSDFLAFPLPGRTIWATLRLSVK